MCKSTAMLPAKKGMIYGTTALHRNKIITNIFFQFYTIYFKNQRYNPFQDALS